MDRPDRTARPTALEPMRVGMLLDAAFRLWRSEFRRLIGFLVVVNAPLAIWKFIYMQSNIVDIAFDGILLVEDPDAYNQTVILLTVGQMIAAALTFAVLTAFLTPRYIGEGATLGGSLGKVGRRIFPFLGLLIMYGGMVGIGSVALLVPGVVLGLLFALAFPAFFQEGRGAVDSLRRGSRLVRSRMGPLFGLLFGAWLIQAVPGGIATLLGLIPPFDESILAVSALGSFGWALSTILLGPLLPAALTAAYYDARVRKEGFDVELAVSALGPAPDGQG